MFGSFVRCSFSFSSSSIYHHHLIHSLHRISPSFFLHSRRSLMMMMTMFTWCLFHPSPPYGNVCVMNQMKGKEDNLYNMFQKKSWQSITPTMFIMVKILLPKNRKKSHLFWFDFFLFCFICSFFSVENYNLFFRISIFSGYNNRETEKRKDDSKWCNETFSFS